MELIISLDEVAARYRLSLKTLTDQRWRAKVGLPLIRLGGRVVGVRASDLEAALRREEFTPERGPSAA